MKDNFFDEMSELDDEIVDKITARYPDMKNDEAERIFRKTMAKIDGQENFSEGDSVSGIEMAKHRNFWAYGTAAAAVLVAVMTVPLVISGLKRSPDPTPGDNRDPLPPFAAQSTGAQESTETGESTKKTKLTVTTEAADTEQTSADKTEPVKVSEPAKTAAQSAKTTQKTTNKTTSKSGKTTTSTKTTAAKTTTTAIIDPTENRLREQMIAQGKLPKNQPRITLASAKEIIRNAELEHLAGAAKMQYIWENFNSIHGAPDLEWGSGISYVTYYLDDKGSEQIDFSISSGDYTVQYSNKLTGESCELTQKPIGMMTLAELNEAEKNSFTDVYTRRRMILSGELPENQPRLDLKTANDVMDSLSGAPTTIEYMLSRMNEIHGAPDVEYGSGTTILEYYFDEYGVERMTVNMDTGRVEYSNQNTGAKYGLYGRVNWASDMSLEHLIEYEQGLGNNAFCMRRRMVLAGDLPERMPYLTLDKARELIAKCGAPSSSYDYEWMMKVKKEFDDYCGAPDIVYLSDPGDKKIVADYMFDGSYRDGKITFILDPAENRAFIQCFPSKVSDTVFDLIPEPVSK